MRHAGVRVVGRDSAAGLRDRGGVDLPVADAAMAAHIVRWRRRLLGVGGIHQRDPSMRHARLGPLACVLALALLGAASACTGEDPSTTDYGVILHFDTARVRLSTKRDTLRLVVELAVTADQQTLGLMERRTLPDNTGMLFLYAATQSDSSAFWMYRTRIPLDIAFIDSTGTIRTVHRMEPCTALLAKGCPSYPAGAPFRAALEVNAGYFSRHGVQPGDRLLLGDTTVHSAGARRE